ncbi:MAG: hypothetical protein AAFR79_18300, partial [Pseudomonadota bacterium]
MAKDDAQKSGSAPAPKGSPLPVAQEAPLTERLQALADRSQKVWMRSLDRAIDDITTLRPDPL